MAFEFFRSDGESPAHEVFAVMGGPEGHFGHSSKIRNRALGDGVEFYVGQIFKHKKFGYYGVIIGWDRLCNAPMNWKQQMLGRFFTIFFWRIEKIFSKGIGRKWRSSRFMRF